MVTMQKEKEQKTEQESVSEVDYSFFLMFDRFLHDVNKSNNNNHEHTISKDNE